MPAQTSDVTVTAFPVRPASRPRNTLMRLPCPDVRTYPCRRAVVRACTCARVQLGGNIFDVCAANLLWCGVFTSGLVWLGCCRRFSVERELRALKRHRAGLRRQYVQQVSE
jgi:hypothetical protein